MSKTLARQFLFRICAFWFGCFHWAGKASWASCMGSSCESVSVVQLSNHLTFPESSFTREYIHQDYLNLSTHYFFQDLVSVFDFQYEEFWFQYSNTSWGGGGSFWNRTAIERKAGRNAYMREQSTERATGRWNLSICFFFHPSVHLSLFCLSIHRPISPSAHLPIYSSIHPALSVYLSFCVWSIYSLYYRYIYIYGKLLGFARSHKTCQKVVLSCSKPCAGPLFWHFENQETLNPLKTLKPETLNPKPQITAYSMCFSELFWTILNW